MKEHKIWATQTARWAIIQTPRVKGGPHTSANEQHTQHAEIVEKEQRKRKGKGEGKPGENTVTVTWPTAESREGQWRNKNSARAAGMTRALAHRNAAKREGKLARAGAGGSWERRRGEIVGRHLGPTGQLSSGCRGRGDHGGR